MTKIIQPKVKKTLLGYKGSVSVIERDETGKEEEISNVKLGRFLSFKGANKKVMELTCLLVS